MRRPGRVLLLLFVVPAFAGCLFGGKDSQLRLNRWTRLKPQPPQLSPDVVILHYIQIEREGKDRLSESIWKEGDEQFLPAAVRNALTRNGFRIAKMRDRLGPELLRMLDNSNPKEQGRGVQTLAGQTTRIQMTEVLESWNCFYREEEETHGKQLMHAQGFLEAVATLGKDHSVRLLLAPIVEHGERVRIPVVANNLSGLEIKAERPTKRFADMKMEFEVESGDFLLIGSIPDSDGTLGGSFFTKTVDDKRIESVLLLRAYRPSREDLFQAGYELNDFFLTPAGTQTAARTTVHETVGTMTAN